MVHHSPQVPEQTRHPSNPPPTNRLPFEIKLNPQIAVQSQVHD